MCHRPSCWPCSQAFAAVQASVVHLQGVPVSQRFALVPLGPPLLAYSPTAKVCGVHLLPALAMRIGAGLLASNAQ